MKQKNLLAVLLIVILVGTGIGYAYFATDAFKSDKDLFFKYALGMDVEYEHDEIDEKLMEYLSKKGNTTFTNKGEVTLNMTGTATEDEQAGLDMLNNSKVTFEGKTDNQEKLAEQTITLDFGQGINIPVEFKKDKDVYGIQTDLLDSKFIAIRNDNLVGLAQRFELDVEGLPNKIELENFEFTEEELTTLKEKYLTLLNENLEDELFSKEEKDGQTIIKLNATQQKVSDVITKILETVKNDELIKNKLSLEYINELEISINDLLTDVQSGINENGKIEINVYTENKKTKKCEIISFTELEEDRYEESKIVIEGTQKQIIIKIYTEDELVMDITSTVEKSENDVIIKANVKLLEEGENVVEASVSMQYKNLFGLDNVEENIDVKVAFDGIDDEGVEEKGKIDVKINNAITFVENAEIEKLDEANSIILNDATDEELQTLLLSIYQKLGLI